MFKNNRRAEAGIGTLVLFIALIMVAAVAAGVLIQTSSSLQSKALGTGRNAQAQVSTQALAMYVYGKDASNAAHSINRTFMKIKLAPGSEAINLNSSLITVDLKAQTIGLTFSSAVNCSRETPGANGLFNTSHYNLHYGYKSLIGDGNAYLERGDVLELCFALPLQVAEGEDLRLKFTPKIGSPTVVETKMPDVMLSQQVKLFP